MGWGGGRYGVVYDPLYWDEDTEGGHGWVLLLYLWFVVE